MHLARRNVLILGIGLACVGLFIGYLRMAVAVGTTADGASIALQSWDVLHGNLALHDWTLADVTFYSTELMQLAVVEIFTGLDPVALRAGAALTYPLIVVLVVLLAKGRTNTRLAWSRAALAVALLSV